VEILEKIAIGLGVMVLIQVIKPVKVQIQGFLGIGMTFLALYGVGALVKMVYEIVHDTGILQKIGEWIVRFVV
jgi:hypothetical protein